ncbi:MAG: alcohol dehydrogenase catalytic domain-containing protein [Thermoanaerobaculales bacterium]|nr:alcohol dehydrogenase catalytic domain-containing protein [Thermoanaerobaculales bacterium]
MAAHDGDGGLRLESREIPAPGQGEILLKLGCCGFCGTDLFKLVNRTVPEGTVLGHEPAGTVQAVGPGVDRFAIGDRVVVSHHVACGKCALCRRGSRTLCPVFKENLMDLFSFGQGPSATRLGSFLRPCPTRRPPFWSRGHASFVASSRQRSAPLTGVRS